MGVSPWTQRLATAVLALGLVACGGPDTDAPEPAVEEPAADPAGLEPAEEAESDDGAETPAEAGGEEEAAGESPSSSRRSLLEQGIRRTTSLEDAVGKLPFTPFEPADLPEGSDRTVVHLIEPIEGIENPALPALRLIYDIEEGLRSLILVQAPAHGETGEGQEIEVAGIPARLSSGNSPVLVFERDGIYIEFRGSGFSGQQLIALAESLQPYDQLGQAEERAADDAPADAGDDEDAGGESDSSEAADDGG